MNCNKKANATKVSVIIPVYGVERYIERCMRSLFGQTMQDGIEFIFVNDCTPDRSIDIIHSLLDEYPNRRQQTHIIDHAENQGLAVARVTGVKAARGEFVIHCDSDDWVEPDMYELLYNKAAETGADITGCDFFMEYAGKTEICRQDFSLTTTESVNAIFNGGVLDAYLWNRMIKRSFYLHHDFKAPDNVSLLEDMAVSIPMHIWAEKVAYVSKPLYHYNRQQSSTMSAAITRKGIDSSIIVMKLLRQYITDAHLSSYNKRLIRVLRPLITSVEFYDPARWSKVSDNIPLSLYPGIISKIPPFLIRHGWVHLNFLIVKLLRSIKS